MNRKYGIHLCLLGGMLFTGALTCANADEWNKKTYVTTSRSIEVPGAVLPPGKYVFKLLDSQSNRHIVQVLNERENHVYTTNLAIPKQRMEPADKTILTFYEMPGGGPEPVRAWFYPGDTIGQEFAYPKRRAMEISRMMREHVPVLAEARTRDMEPMTPQPVETPAPVTQPMTDDSANLTADNSADRVATPVDTPEPTAATSTPDTSGEPVPADSNAEDQTPAPPAATANEPVMPHTAGNIAGIALIGLGCIAIAASLGLATRSAGSRS